MNARPGSRCCGPLRTRGDGCESGEVSWLRKPTPRPLFLFDGDFRGLPENATPRITFEPSSRWSAAAEPSLDMAAVRELSAHAREGGAALPPSHTYVPRGSGSDPLPWLRWHCRPGKGFCSGAK